jgi:hypothetical protein
VKILSSRPAPNSSLTETVVKRPWTRRHVLAALMQLLCYFLCKNYVDFDVIDYAIFYAVLYPRMPLRLTSIQLATKSSSSPRPYLLSTRLLWRSMFKALLKLLRNRTDSQRWILELSLLQQTLPFASSASSLSRSERWRFLVIMTILTSLA